MKTNHYLMALVSLGLMSQETAEAISEGCENHGDTDLIVRDEYGNQMTLEEIKKRVQF